MVADQYNAPSKWELIRELKRKERRFMEFTAASGKKLDLIVVEDHQATAVPCADIICETISRSTKTSPVTICFSTGDSPLPTYRELVARHRQNGLTFRNVRAFLLDEYMGLPAGHQACFRSILEENLYRHLDVRPENLFFFFGPVEDHMQTCYRFESELNATGGPELMILGIGGNGHVAFNEPGTRPDSRTRMIHLSESTRKANARFFSSIDEVPTHALSIGIQNILEAKNILLIATGEGKTNALKQALTGPISTEVPASYLQNFSGKMTVVIDRSAAKGLGI